MPDKTKIQEQEYQIVIQPNDKPARYIAVIALILTLITSFSVFFQQRSNINAITEARKKVTLNTCLAQNERHDAAIKHGIPKFEADIFAPKRDCQLLIKQRFG